MKKCRVIQWGAGYTGSYSLRYILSNPHLELVGLKCFSAANEGKRAGEFCNRQGEGVEATCDTTRLLALEADCVIFMPRDSFTDPSLPGSLSENWWVLDMIALLESGKNVVTSICTGTHWRHMARGEAFRDRLNEACRIGKSTAHFSGFDPGFATDALPYSLASVVGEIKQIRTWEILDYSEYPVATTLQQLGYGVRPENLSDAAMASYPVGWGGALHVVADGMGVVIQNIEFDTELSLSPKTFIAPGGLRIEKDTIAGMRWSLSGIVDGEPRIVINHVNPSAGISRLSGRSLGTTEATA